MPAHQGLGADDCENLKDRREPAIQLDEEPAIAVRKLEPAPHLAAQDDQLMSERHIFRLKPTLRLEWRGQHGQNKADQRDHRANLADSVIRQTRIEISVHTAWIRVSISPKDGSSSTLPNTNSLATEATRSPLT